MLFREKPSQWSVQAAAYGAEALEDETDISVERAEVTTQSSGVMAVRLFLTVSGQGMEVGLDVSP